MRPGSARFTVSPRTSHLDSAFRRWWLDVNDGVGDLGELLHQAVLDDVGELVRVAQQRVGGEPHVQVQEDVIERAAGADVMAGATTRCWATRR